jgi:hypothetical protein
MIPTNRTRLKRLFLDGFSALDVAESLISFDFESSAFHAGHLMTEFDFDAGGVRVAGSVAGYVLRDELKDGICGGNLKPFDTADLLDENSSLADAIVILDQADRVFLKMLGPVGAIITRSDLQKPPARMWLFGLITILEMAFSELIDEHYEDDEWADLLSAGRVAKARELLEERRRRNQAVHLSQCLQLSDKGQILIKVESTRRILGIASVRQGRETIKMIEALRNNLAHAQDIVTSDWITIVRLVENLDRVLD